VGPIVYRIMHINQQVNVDSHSYIFVGPISNTHSYLILMHAQHITAVADTANKIASLGDNSV